MIVFKINQIVGSWIRSTAERLIAADAARLFGIRSNSITGSWCSRLEVLCSHRYAFCSAIPLPDQSSDLQRRTRF